MHIKNTHVLIGNRIKSVRMLAGYSRKAFSDMTGISAATLRAWEEPIEKRRGITKKGAFRLVEALKGCNVFCTIEWILHGIGYGPKLIEMQDTSVLNGLNTVTWDEEESIFKDIESFKVNNINPIVAIIIDGSMLPFYSYGDYVGGLKRTGKEIVSLASSNCIVELPDLTLVRRIKSIQSDGYMTLSALNIDPHVTIPEIHTKQVVSAAKIIWHRSREKIRSIVV